MDKSTLLHFKLKGIVNQAVNEININKISDEVIYSQPMPSIENLMEPWPLEIQKNIKEITKNELNEMVILI